MKSKVICLLILVFWCLSPNAKSEVPQLISYQGILKDSSGNYLTGTYSIQFKIYNVSTSGSALWTETQSSVSVSSGKFSVQLGSVTPLDLDFDENYWLSIKVDTDAEMTPRVQLTSIGYAYRAEVATNVVNGFTEEEHNVMHHKDIEGVKSNTVLIAKTNFKLDATTLADANNLGSMVLDVFTDDSGISAIPSSNYVWRGSPDYDVIVSPGGIDANARLVLHANGSDASTTFNDSSTYTHTVTANGDAQLDTAQNKFGSASVFFDGSGDSLMLTDSSDWDFGGGNFTIDLWIRLNGNNKAQAILQRDEYNYEYALFVNSNNTVTFTSYSGGATRWSVTSTSTMSTSAWKHVAAVRNGSSQMLFIDGARQGSDGNYSGSLADGSAGLRLGTNEGGAIGFDGWMDEIRISKGIARWIEDFTPPSAEYSSAGGAATVISTTSIVPSSPATAMIISHETLNGGDITYYVSRNNGSNWTECEEESLCDLSAQPSGAQMKWKVEIEDDAELNAIAVVL